MSDLQWKQISLLLIGLVCYLRQDGFQRDYHTWILKGHETKQSKQDRSLKSLKDRSAEFTEICLPLLKEIWNKLIKLLSDTAGQIISFWRLRVHFRSRVKSFTWKERLTEDYTLEQQSPSLGNIKESAGNPLLVKEAIYCSGCSAIPNAISPKKQSHYKSYNIQ